MSFVLGEVDVYEKTKVTLDLGEVKRRTKCYWGRSNLDQVLIEVLR